MNFKEEIKKQLQLLKKSGIDRRKAEDQLGYAENYIDQALSKGGNLKLLNSLKVLSMNVDKSNIAAEPEQTYQSKRNTLKNGEGKKRVPLYDAPAAAGNTSGDMTPIAAPAGTIDVGDLLHDSQAAIRIYGNSMIPNYPPGCVVGLARCESKFIEPGEVYVIETRDRRILKRLFYKDDNSDGDFITCYSDNIMNFKGGWPKHDGFEETLESSIKPFYEFRYMYAHRLSDNYTTPSYKLRYALKSVQAIILEVMPDIEDFS